MKMTEPGKLVRRTILLSLCLLLAACNRHKDDFVLEGTIAPEVGDTILVSGIDSRFTSIDTIICKDGSLKWSFTPDTTTTLVLSLADGRMHPVIADKGQHALIDIPQAGIGEITVTGDEYNRILQDFRRESAVDQLKKTTLARIDSLITTDPFSPVIPYLIYEYGVRIYHASPAELNELINRLSGSMQDDPFITELKSRFPKAEKRTVYLNDMMFIDTAHVSTNFSNFSRGMYKLVYVWASYDEQSLKKREIMKKTAQKYSIEEDIIFADISIDTNPARWLKALESDTADTAIENLTSFCDTKGWNSQLIEANHTNRIPTFLLLSPQDRLVHEYRDTVQIFNAVDSVLLEMWESAQKNKAKKTPTKKQKEIAARRKAEQEKRRNPKKLIF